jgi:predicted DNA-binding ribbon-helix-helix protein
MSRLISRNVRDAEKWTSMRLEAETWDAVRDICRRENISTDELIARAVRSRPLGRRTSAVRVFILMYYRTASRASAKAIANGRAEAHQNGVHRRRGSGK